LKFGAKIDPIEMTFGRRHFFDVFFFAVCFPVVLDRFELTNISFGLISSSYQW